MPRVLILRAPGTNCDLETAFAFEKAGAQCERVHINRALEEPRRLFDFQILCIPGGFSYGDDLGAGRILADQMRRRLGERLTEFRDRGGLTLGICNGFQALIQTGLLAPDDAAGPVATLAGNDSGRFEDRWVRLGAAGSKCVFVAGIERMYLPVAHGEGKFVARDPQTLATLEANGQLVLRYLPQDGSTPDATPLCDATGRVLGYLPQDGRLEVSYPDNPNGSVADVAGICDATGRVLGLMPHPERHIDPMHHPRWTREPRREVGDGFKLFQNAVNFFR